MLSDYQVSAQVHLHQALCMVINGGIKEGTQLAATTLDAIPPNLHSHMVTETGRRVLLAVPTDQRANPAVIEYREVLTAQATRP